MALVILSATVPAVYPYDECRSVPTTLKVRNAIWQQLKPLALQFSILPLLKLGAFHIRSLVRSLPKHNENG